LHRASGQAVVRLDGVDHYLGPHGSPSSHGAYERAIAEWRVQHAEQALKEQATTAVKRYDLTVAQLLLRYREFALAYYRSADGRPTKELQSLRYSLRPVRQLHGSTKLRDFGPLALKAVRQHMIEKGWSRKLINSCINRVRRFVKWAVSEELAPPSAYEALRSVAGLQFGRTAARETEPVRPVPDAWISPVLPFLSAQVRAMVEVQRLTGMRPAEVVIMRSCDVDVSGEIWFYEPETHKNQWRGHRRIVPIGPRAQQIIRPFLTLSTTAYVFNPIDAERERNALRRLTRKTPMTPSQASRRPKAQAKRERYSVDSYRRAIEYGISQANKLRAENDQIPHWYPLQLRHSRGTEIRKSHGL